ncbi:MAG: chloride channel protein [Anaerolineaceae bacterium]|nr:chloride channel protein [Anaerolineaceae bacterium]
MNFTRSKNALKHIFSRLEISEDTFLIITAILVGLGVGVGAIILHHLIEAVEWVGYTWLPEVLSGLGKAYVIIFPAIAGLIVGCLVYFFAQEAKGHGVPEVMEAVALKGGRIRPIVAIIKSVASALTIGSGGSAGREGPIVQIGSALGSTLGQKLNLSSDRVRNLVACGAAGGIAATFNAPIAGVIFALEIILGEFSVRYLSTVVLASVVASVVGRSAFGNTPAFVLPMEYGVRTVWEFAFYPILGLLAALVGVVFVRLLYWTEDLFDNWKGFPEWGKPSIGAILLGILALAYPSVTGITWDEVPQIFSVGYEIIEGALSNELALGVVGALMVLKLLATSLTLGSGSSGGVFAPALFMGAMLGAGFELVISSIFPDIVAPAGAYALVGMAAVFAASAHAPITAIIMLTELTDDHRIILPLMLTVIVATLAARIMLNKQSIYTLKLTRRGIHLQQGRDVDIMHGVLVNEVMSTQVHSVTVGMTLDELSNAFIQTHHHGLAVLDKEGALWGVVTVSDLDRALARNLPGDTDISQICTRRPDLLVAYPDETIGDALYRLGRRGLGRIPVVSRDDPDRLLGIIRRSNIVTAYNLALTRRTEIQQQAKHITTRSPEGTEFIELTLSEGNQAVGKSVQEIAPNLPDDCILVSIQRKAKVLIPHGTTVFQQGDTITAFIHSKDVNLLYARLIG